MRGRPKKFKNGARVLLFLDKDLLNKFDLLISNRSDAVNKLIKTYVNDRIR